MSSSARGPGVDARCTTLHESQTLVFWRIIHKTRQKHCDLRKAILSACKLATVGVVGRWLANRRGELLVH